MELTLADRKQPGHKDYEHSGDPLTDNVQTAFEALDLAMENSLKKDSPENAEEIRQVQEIKRSLDENLNLPVENRKVTIDLLNLVERVNELTTKL